MPKAKPERLNRNYKNALKYLKAYKNAVANDGAPRVDYMETIAKYVGTKGQPLRRELRYQPAIKEFNEALRQFNATRPRASDLQPVKAGSKNALNFLRSYRAATAAGAPQVDYLEAINKYVDKDGHIKTDELFDPESAKEFNRALKKFNQQRPRKKDLEDITEKVKQPDGVNFSDLAKNALGENNRLWAGIARDARNKLVDELGIGSDFINQLASDASISTDDFYNILGMLARTIETMPDEVRGDAVQDDYYKVVLAAKEQTGAFDIDMFTAFLGADDVDAAVEIADEMTADDVHLSPAEMTSLLNYMSDNGIAPRYYADVLKDMRESEG